MDWKQGRRSDNVRDAAGGGRGMRLGGGRGLSLGAVAAIFGIGLLLGKSPLEMLGLLSELQGGAPVTQQPSQTNNESRDFVRAILGETEDVWGALFQRGGKHYEQPTLILFAGRVQTACGGATSASGPFYCPADHQVYLDTSFFDEMSAHLGGGGDFAHAYVIAHEVGHHVQTLLGVSQKVEQARRAGRDTAGDNGLSVRLELQADCFAGVWAYHAQQRHQWLQAGDVEEALNTASAIGDDRLQKQSRGQVVPDAFTHGTSQQRVRWFQAGFQSGEAGRCDTFAAKSL